MVAIVIIYLYDQNLSVQQHHDAKIMSNKITHRGITDVVEWGHGVANGLIIILKRNNNNPNVHSLHSSIEITDTMNWLNSNSPTSEMLRVSIDEKRIEIIRGSLYMRPAFYSIRNKQFYFATEKKALQSIGLTEISRLEPGSRITFHQGKKLDHQIVDALEHPPLKEYSSANTILDQLRKSILDSFHRLEGHNVGVLFSGGVDSGLVAHLSNRFASGTTLFSVSAEGSHDAKAAKGAADLLGLPLKSITINARIVWNLLPEIIFAIEDSNRMNVAIALPFMIAARIAKKSGYEIILSGQGPDELFAGYARHLKIMEEHGPVSLNKELWREISVTHKANLERDEKAVAYGGCDLIFPYLYREFVMSALSIHPKWKIKQGPKPIRKFIFRELAKNLGLPDSIVWAPKRATQFSSRTDRLLVEAIYSDIGKLHGLSRNKSEKIVQLVLDRIAFELGLSYNSVTSDAITDWSPVDHLLDRSIIHQQ